MRLIQKESQTSIWLFVYGEGAHGNRVHIGAAWKKKGKQRQFLSLEIDDPSLPARLSALAFRQQHSGAYDIMWKRHP